jgi:hypothetical protein
MTPLLAPWLPGSLECMPECDATRALTCLLACQMFCVWCFLDLCPPFLSSSPAKTLLSRVNGLIQGHDGPSATSDCSAQRLGLDYWIVSFFVLLLAGCARHVCPPERKKPALPAQICKTIYTQIASCVCFGRCQTHQTPRSLACKPLCFLYAATSAIHGLPYLCDSHFRPLLIDLLAI